MKTVTIYDNFDNSENFDNSDNFENFWQLWEFMTILKIIDIYDFWWDPDYNSDNWEPEFMTIFATWQLRVTWDSICNSCDV